MSNVPADLKYAKSHEWLRSEDDGIVTVGITDHAQDALGDIVFIETPEVGAQLVAGEPCAVVESVKAASDIYAPVSGEVTAINEELEAAPETVNDDAYDKGWMFRVRLADPAEVDALLNADAYAALLESE